MDCTQYGLPDCSTCSSTFSIQASKRNLTFVIQASKQNFTFGIQASKQNLTFGQEVRVGLEVVSVPAFHLAKPQINLKLFATNVPIRSPVILDLSR